MYKYTGYPPPMRSTAYRCGLQLTAYAVTGISEGIPDESPEVRLLFVNRR